MKNLAPACGNVYREQDMSTNPIASALGKLGKGVPKTMTPAAMRQRKNAVKSRWVKYRKAKRARAASSNRKNNK